MNKLVTRNRRRNFFTVALAFLLRAGLVVLITGAVAVTSLRWIDPVTSSVIFQSNFSARNANSSSSSDNPDTSLQSVSFDWRPLGEISEPMIVAVIAAEDQRFVHHHGLDFVELSKALRESFGKGKGRPRGASTITQQAAKNLFLWSGRSYLRKVIEAGLAVYIDFAWGKRRVLEIYLNIVQFGDRIYGVENAAQHFFGKPAARLNRHEAARLAAVLPSPRLRSVTAPGESVLQRQQWILKQMRRLDRKELMEGIR